MNKRSTLVALALSAGIPVTLVALSPNNIYQGENLLKISVPGVPWAIRASSTYGPDGPVKEIDYLPGRNFIGIEGQAGYVELGVILNHPEFRFGEVLVPWSVVIGTLGFLTAWRVVAIMEYTGLARYVWHLPLFFVGLVVLFGSLIGMVFSP